uniref:RNA polymerase II subunit B1 CTD phosphatase RPAP2 homolog n=1 Tax=Hydra vulgaris TaxID=6087 RepID=T2M9E7_HYDVU
MMDDERKEQIRAKIQSHVRAEEAAYRCVERLAVVECITKEEFRHILSIITLSHYQDITEERFVSKMCGYALCSNKISKVVKQKFHISTNSNKVYDMEERKRFCSLHCFKASKHLERQMQESPFCTTSTEKKITFIDEVVDSTPFVLDCEIKMMEMLKLTDDDKRKAFFYILESLSAYKSCMLFLKLLKKPIDNIQVRMLRIMLLPHATTGVPRSPYSLITEHRRRAFERN